MLQTRAIAVVSLFALSLGSVAASASGCGAATDPAEDGGLDAAFDADRNDAARFDATPTDGATPGTALDGSAHDGSDAGAHDAASDSAYVDPYADAGGFFGLDIPTQCDASVPGAIALDRTEVVANDGRELYFVGTPAGFGVTWLTRTLGASDGGAPAEQKFVNVGPSGRFRFMPVSISTTAARMGVPLVAWTGSDFVATAAHPNGPDTTFHTRIVSPLGARSQEVLATARVSNEQSPSWSSLGLITASHEIFAHGADGGIRSIATLSSAGSWTANNTALFSNGPSLFAFYGRSAAGDSGTTYDLLYSELELMADGGAGRVRDVLVQAQARTGVSSSAPEAVRVENHPLLGGQPGFGVLTVEVGPNVPLHWQLRVVASDGRVVHEESIDAPLFAEEHKALAWSAHTRQFVMARRCGSGNDVGICTYTSAAVPNSPPVMTRFIRTCSLSLPKLANDGTQVGLAWLDSGRAVYFMRLDWLSSDLPIARPN